jgi:transposase
MLSYEQKRERASALYDQGREAVVNYIVELETKLELMDERLKKLEALLHQDSHNSSQPPSNDKNKKYRTPARIKSNRSSGGQSGHKGTTLKRVAKADTIIEHKVSNCSYCGKSLKTIEPDSVSSRQVIDIPPMQQIVTEHRVEEKSCPSCHHVTQASFPADVTKSVQYGKQIKSIATYLMQYQLVPAERTTELLEELFSCSVSQGSLFLWMHELAEKTTTAYNAIKKEVTHSPVVHTDETGVPCEKHNYWLHVVSTLNATYYAIHKKRGKEAMDDIGILPEFSGIAVHDMWASYFRYPRFRNGVCNAHIIRELTFVEEEYKQRWAKKLKAQLLQMNGVVERARSAGRTTLEKRTLMKYRSVYDNLITIGLRKNPRLRGSPQMRGRTKQSKVRNLLERLRIHADSVLLYIHDFRVPFTNNQAERDIRMFKVKNKISGCFRSVLNAQMFCSIRSYISTARKNGISAFAAVVSAFYGQPFIPKNNYAE